MQFDYNYKVLKAIECSICGTRYNTIQVHFDLWHCWGLSHNAILHVSKASQLNPNLNKNRIITS